MTAATQPATPAAPNNNEPVRVNHTARNVIITIVVVAIIAVAAFFGYRAFAGANESSAKGSKGNPVKIGVVGATNPEWVKFKQDAEKAGIYVDIVDFQDYTSENPALDSGELDLNEFQHLLYLANYNVSNKKDLQPIGGTAIYPLGVYSTKVKDIKDLKQGDTVTIPNDETNQARAIGVLKAAGLVTLKGDWTAFSTPAYIDEAKSKVKVTPLKAEQVATTCLLYTSFCQHTHSRCQCRRGSRSKQGDCNSNSQFKEVGSTNHSGGSSNLVGQLQNPASDIRNRKNQEGL